MNFAGSTLCQTSNWVRVKHQTENFKSSQFIVTTVHWPSNRQNITQFYKRPNTHFISSYEQIIQFGKSNSKSGRIIFDIVENKKRTLQGLFDNNVREGAAKDLLQHCVMLIAQCVTTVSYQGELHSSVTPVWGRGGLLTLASKSLTMERMVG